MVSTASCLGKNQDLVKLIFLRGLTNSFGVFQSIYTVDLLSSYSPSDIAWIGSVQTFLLLFVGALTGPIFDKGYFRSLLIVGSALVVLGMMMTSLATAYSHFMLAQGICVGIGSGCLFTPSIALLATYFTTKVGIAMGLSAMGSGIGRCISRP